MDQEKKKKKYSLFSQHLHQLPSKSAQDSAGGAKTLLKAIEKFLYIFF